MNESGQLQARIIGFEVCGTLCGVYRKFMITCRNLLFEEYGKFNVFSGLLE